MVSRAFQTHITFLAQRNLLSVPSDQLQNIFHKFAEAKSIPWQRYRGIQTKAAKESDGSDSSYNPSEDTEDATNDQDPFHIIHQGSYPFEEISIAIQGWVKLFIQHFHAKRILESFAKKEGMEIPIKIKVLGVNQPEKPLPMPTWEALTEVLRSSLHNQNTERQHEMIKVFRDHFQTARPTNNNNNTTTTQTNCDGKNTIFRVVSDIIMEKAKDRPRYYNMHCEVALAGLVAASKYPVNVIPYVDKEVAKQLAVGLIPYFLQQR